MNSDLDHAIERVLATAKHHGATDVEVFAEEVAKTIISIRDGAVEMMNISESRGIGVRIFAGRRFAFMAACDFDNLEQMVQKTTGMASEMDADDCVGLPEMSSAYPDVTSFDPQLATLSSEDKIRRLIHLEEQVKQKDSAIRTERYKYHDRIGHYRIVNTDGVDVQGRSSQTVAYGIGILKKGEQGGRGYFVTSSIGPTALEKPGLADQLIKIARTSVEGRPFSPRKMTVVLEPSAAHTWLAGLGHALQGDRVVKQASFLSEQIGTQVAHEQFSIIDDRTLNGGLDSMPFDGEGMPAREVRLIEQGVLRTYQCDTYWGRRLGSGSTSSATRSGYERLPAPGSSNIYIAQGDMPREELIAAVKDGMLVVNLISVGGIDPVTGNFSAAASGFRIENGRVTSPVAKVTVGGKMSEMLRNIIGIGSDLEWCTSYGAPTIAVADMVVGG